MHFLLIISLIAPRYIIQQFFYHSVIPFLAYISYVSKILVVSNGKTRVSENYQESTF